MHATLPSSLDSAALSRRLVELAGNERDAQVDFLLHLAEFDQRRAFLEEGHDSLWTYCQRVLHLREGPAWRRIQTMRVLRRLPALEAALRDGRLCLSTVTLLDPLLTEENLPELVAAAAYRTKKDVEHLVASLQPRTAPKPGVRKLPERADPKREVARGAEAMPPAPAASAAPAPTLTLAAPDASPALATPEPRRPEMTAVSRDEWSLRVTIDSALKADLETLENLLSHTCGRDLTAVLREAIRCGIDKHGKRKGAVKPTRERKATSSAKASAVSHGRDIPAAVRRQVWERDGGRCAWVAEDGCRCGSRWKLEIDHIHPVALGGPSTIDNVRLLCRSHNDFHATLVFGREHMERVKGRITHPGMSGPRHERSFPPRTVREP